MKSDNKIWLTLLKWTNWCITLRGDFFEIIPTFFWHKLIEIITVFDLTPEQFCEPCRYQLELIRLYIIKFGTFRICWSFLTKHDKDMRQRWDTTRLELLNYASSWKLIKLWTDRWLANYRSCPAFLKVDSLEFPSLTSNTHVVWLWTVSFLD